MLKPQDVVVLLKKVAKLGPPASISELSSELGISRSEISASLLRSVDSQLYDKRKDLVKTGAFEEFLIHGVKYSFPAKRGEVTRGVPTGHAAPPLIEFFDEDQLPPVWPSAAGLKRGYSVTPLYPSVPLAAAADFQLYELLALVDAIREGRAREVKLGIEQLHERIVAYRDTSRAFRSSS